MRLTGSIDEAQSGASERTAGGGPAPAPPTATCAHLLTSVTSTDPASGHAVRCRARLPSMPVGRSGASNVHFALIGVHPASIHRHLIVLERHGLVSADVAPGRRRGQSVTWRTETDQVAEFGRTWVRYACSSADSPT